VGINKTIPERRSNSEFPGWFFGRNAIETTFYIQQLFPQKGVRFISISDQFDIVDGITATSFEQVPSLRIPITKILNGKIWLYFFALSHTASRAKKQTG